MWTALPGIVTEVNLVKMILSVQPSIQGQVTDESGAVVYVNLPLLINVPIQFPMAGGFAFTLPIKANDEVLVVFSSRCIDAWWQSGGIGKPMEARMHDLSDGFAIVGIKSQPKVLASISSTEAQLRTESGSTYVALTADGKIKLVGSIVVTGNMSVTGNVLATGNVQAAGLVTALKDTTPIQLATHTHSGVTVGTGTSGPPLP